MQEIEKLFFKSDSVDDLGLEIGLERNLKPIFLQQCGVASRNGKWFFAYHDRQALVRVKERDQKDKKKMRFLLTGSPLPFFNKRPKNPHLEHKYRDCLFITEGEFDCVALTQLGLPYVVSLPSGSSGVKTALQANYEYLSDFKEIYICSDMDEPGIKCAQEMAKYISPEKYRRVKFPYKDANEWLLKDNPEFEDLEHLIINAERINHHHFIKFSEGREFLKDRNVGISTQWPSLNKYILGWRAGELTVISADTGVGKTTSGINFIWDLVSKGHGAWVSSNEMKDDAIWRKFATQKLQKDCRFISFSEEEKNTVLDPSIPLYISSVKSFESMEQIEGLISSAARIFDCKAILLDHLDYIYPLWPSKDYLEQMKESVKFLHEAALKHNIHIFLIVHCKKLKDDDDPSISDIKGSSSVAQFADTIIMLKRLSRTDPGNKKVNFRICKNRGAQAEGNFDLHFDSSIEKYLEVYSNFDTNSRSAFSYFNTPKEKFDE